jgi:hypothetical protein
MIQKITSNLVLISASLHTISKRNFKSPDITLCRNLTVGKYFGTESFSNREYLKFSDEGKHNSKQKLWASTSVK